MNISRAWRLRNRDIVAYSEYPGCQYCHEGIGITLYLFPPEQQEWLEGVEITDAPQPDEFGGNRGYGLAMDILQVEDLLAALPEIEAECGSLAGDANGYASLEDWLKDNGIHFLRRAMFKKWQRHAREHQQHEEPH